MGHQQGATAFTTRFRITMPINITVPRLGWSMEEGTFLEWLKRDGDFVSAGDPLFTLESDKATQEIEAIDSGILRIPLDSPKPGDTIKVGHLLGYLLAKGEAMPTVHAEDRVIAVETMRKNDSSAMMLSPKISRTGTPASPRARRAANTHHVELSTLQPTGTGGRIRECDVLAAGAQSTAAPSSMGVVPITTMRRAIATRMVHSLNNTAPVTITCRCDASQLVTVREQLKAADACPLPSYTDIIAKITASALVTHPMLTARWDGERLLVPEHIGIGIAVDTDAGLLVPVLRDVATLPLTAIASQSRRLFEAARAGRLSTAEMEGGCFTISNLGSFGIEAFTPIINHPETAILGLGAIIREPVALEDGTLTIRQQMTLSLTFDHRILDGAPAARFLQTLRQSLEEPVAWLI